MLRWVGAGMDRALAQLTPLVPDDTPGPRREAVLAVLNGVLGDRLSETGNPLAFQMALRQGGRTLELDRRELLLSERPGLAQARPGTRRRAGTRPRRNPELTLAFPEAHRWIGFGRGVRDAPRLARRQLLAQADAPAVRSDSGLPS